jgi:hypothetical protein
MNAKCPCQHCNGHIEFEPDQAGQTVVCPHCGLDTTLFIPVEPTKHDRILDANSRFASETRSKQPASKPRPKSAQDYANEHLKFIRDNSCYGTLRSIINVCAGIAGTIAVLICMGGASESIAASADRLIKLLIIFGALAGIGLSIVVIIGVRQLSFLLIDIADMLLHRHTADKD